MLGGVQADVLQMHLWTGNLNAVHHLCPASCKVLADRAELKAGYGSEDAEARHEGRLWHMVQFFPMLHHGSIRPVG